MRLLQLTNVQHTCGEVLPGLRRVLSKKRHGQLRREGRLLVLGLHHTDITMISLHENKAGNERPCAAAVCVQVL